VTKVGVVGLGYWGPNLARNFDELGALGALCDLDESLRERFAARHPTATMYSDYDDLLADESIDGVVIVTAHSSIDYADVVRRGNVVVDFRNATRGAEVDGKVWKL
jgi:UDP-N-acetyl-D-mannosaminuronate dehydrogenase